MYSVFVNGEQVNDNLLSLENAIELKKDYLNKGFIDVRILVFDGEKYLRKDLVI